MSAPKIISEARGEVQEMIDVCDFAVGLSRQLYGLTMPSERPFHHMRELWHPLGVVGVITAFNFPVAVFAWNAALALICGNTLVWKPSEKTPLVALATQALLDQAFMKFSASAGYKDVRHISQVVVGDSLVGHALAENPRVPLVSATGSTRMGRAVAKTVASRLGRSLLELGGNNAMIVCPSADLSMAKRSIVFSAVGTAGQRCTSLRRLLVHRTLMDQLTDELAAIYKTLKIGNPLEEGVLVGPLIDADSVSSMQASLNAAIDQGGHIVYGGKNLDQPGFYVTPALVRMSQQTEIVRYETFAPILYIMPWQDFDQALEVHNAVPQGLSSCCFTKDMGLTPDLK